MAVVAQRDILVDHAKLGLAVRVHSKVLVIARVMTIGIVEAMLLVVRIEMSPRRFEVGRIALGVLMEVQRMFAQEADSRV